jgi:hypothetical protein
MKKEIIQIYYKERFKPASGISLFMDSGYCSQFRVYDNGNLSGMRSDVIGFFGEMPGPKKIRFVGIGEETQESILDMLYRRFGKRPSLP